MGRPEGNDGTTFFFLFSFYLSHSPIIIIIKVVQVYINTTKVQQR